MLACLPPCLLYSLRGSSLSHPLCFLFVLCSFLVLLWNEHNPTYLICFECNSYYTKKREGEKKRWEDNVTEWTGLKLGEALRKAENREEWRTVVARSFLVPQRSTRLRDK